MSEHMEQYSEAQLLAAYERYEKKKEEVRDRAVKEIEERQGAVDDILQIKWRSRDEMLKEFMEEVHYHITCLSFTGNDYSWVEFQTVPDEKHDST
jgi:hypothetical protein